MTFQDIEFELISVAADHIYFPIQKLNSDIWTAVDMAMADRWFELGGINGIEQGFDLEEIAEVNAYLVPNISQFFSGIGYRVEIITEHGAKLIRHIKVDAEQSTINSILDQYFAEGAPGLAPKFKEFYQRRHTAFNKENAA